VNIKEYISSGIVEGYVLGLASADESAEFERMCDEYPEVLEARNAFEQSFEKNALANAVQPPSYLKNEIFSRIQGQEPEEKSTAIPKKESIAAPVVPMGWLRYVAVASIALLIGSTLLNYYFFTRYKEYSAKYEELVLNQSQMASANKTLQTKLQDYESALNLIKDPAMAVVKMPSVPTSPNANSMTTVYWDTRSKDVYLLVNNLPQPVSDKQYQLWAIIDGKPVDAGVFDISNDPVSFVKMKNIPKAQAFAITLEKKGGNATPTMNAMYVLGKVS
jgi:anti-sigma-K factor RskA